MITRRSSSLVSPRAPSEWTGSYRLGPLDIGVAAVIPIVNVFIYSDEATARGSSSTIPLDLFRKALAISLDSFPHFSGRLRLNADPSIREIVDIGRGAELVTATCSKPLSHFRRSSNTSPFLAGSEIGQTTMSSTSSMSVQERRTTQSSEEEIDLNALPEQGNDLWPPFIPSADFIQSTPVLAVQHTRFACGSVALGIRLLHTVVDAAGYFMYTRHLADVYRRLRSGVEMEAVGRGIKVERPYLVEVLSEQEMVEARKFQPGFAYLPEQRTSEDALDEGANEVKSSFSATPPPPSPRSSPPPSEPTDLFADQSVSVIGQFLPFPTAILTRLKSIAASPACPKPTTFAALCAFVCIRLFQARYQVYSRTDPSVMEIGVEPGFLTPVDVRPRLRGTQWDLGEVYPGNALCLSTSTLPIPVPTPASSLTTDSADSDPNSRQSDDAGDFQRILQAVTATISAQTRHPTLSDPAQIHSTIKWHASLLPHEIEKVQHRNFTHGIWATMISSWQRVDMYDGMAMDGDAPILSRNPFTPVHLIDGLGYLLPPSGSEREQGVGVVLGLALRREVCDFLDLRLDEAWL